MVERQPGTSVGAQGNEGLASNILRSATEYSIVALDLAGTILFWNEGAKRIYGYQANEVVGVLNYAALHSPADIAAERPRKILDEVLRTGAWEGTLGRIRKGGERFTGHAIVNLRLDDSGHPVGFLLMSHDVSGELAAEKKFRGLLEAAPDAIVIVDGNGIVVLVNSQTEAMFGYPRDQILGQSIEKLVPDRFRGRHPEHRHLYLQAARVRPMGAELDLTGLRSDGSEFPVEISLSPLETEDGVLVTAAVRDVTERKRFQVALQEKNDQLEKAILAKDRFLASMSHELRTPLNAIIGFSGILLMKLPGPLTQEQEEQLGIVRNSANHLLSLINDLLDLAKIDSGQVEVHAEPVEIGVLIDDVITTLRPMALAKNLAVVAVGHPPINLHTDKRMLRQVLLNLTNNAIKFTDEGSVTVAFDVEPTNSRVQVSIADTGIGIGAEDQQRLFEPFSQVRGREVREREGSGLGLHLSLKFAALMGGDITIASEEGKGSTFTLWLPSR